MDLLNVFIFFLFYFSGLPVSNYFVKHDNVIGSSVESFGKGFARGLLIAGSWITVTLYILFSEK